MLNSQVEQQAGVTGTEGGRRPTGAPVEAGEIPPPEVRVRCQRTDRN
jgi:hypothetical protein